MPSPRLRNLRTLAALAVGCSLLPSVPTLADEPPPDGGLPIDRRTSGVFERLASDPGPPERATAALRELARLRDDRFVLLDGGLVSVREEARRRLAAAGFDDDRPAAGSAPVVRALDEGDFPLARRLAEERGLDLPPGFASFPTGPGAGACLPLGEVRPGAPPEAYDSTAAGGFPDTGSLPHVGLHEEELFVLRDGLLRAAGDGPPLPGAGERVGYAVGFSRRLFLVAASPAREPASSPPPVDRDDPGTPDSASPGWDRLVAGTIDPAGWHERWRFPADVAAGAASVADGGDDRFRILGPPVVRDESLYLLAEWDGEISLIELRASTGRLLWRQTLYHPARPIEEDLARARIPCTPAESAGVLFCPTGTGTLVAVDRLRRSLLWACRYREPEASAAIRWRRSGDALRGSPSLARPPVVAGDAVLIMPPDGERLVCVDRRTGGERWVLPREDREYVAAVRTVPGGNRVALVVGGRRTAGVSLADGSTVWSRPLGPPAGLGYDTAVGYALPLSGGTVRVLDPATGEDGAFPGIAGADPTRFGHLVPLGDRVISVGSGGHLSFAAAGESAAAPRTPAERLRAARVELARGPDRRGVRATRRPGLGRRVRGGTARRLAPAVLRPPHAAGDRGRCGAA